MPKLRPEQVANYLNMAFQADSIDINVSDGGGMFKVSLPEGLKPSDIQGIAALLILRYIKFKYKVNYPEGAENNIKSKINVDILERVNEFVLVWEKDMVQYLGSTIQDVNKKSLFHKEHNLSEAVAIKFSRLNIGGQHSVFKKLGLGTEFFKAISNLDEIRIHRFDNKH